MRSPSRIPLCQEVALFQLVCCLLFSGNSQDMVLLPAKWESESLSKPLRMCVGCFHANSQSLGCASEPLGVGKHLSSTLGWDEVTFQVDWTHEICVGCGMLESHPVVDIQT